MADVVRKIPWELSSIGALVQSNYTLQDNAYDYALAGIPFLSATRDALPYTERMAEIRKQQFDSFAEPGEQSLQGWWLRSQSTFNGGAGILYQDPDTDNQFNYRFADSLGIDPWTAGEVKLLRAMEPGVASASAISLVRGFVDTSGVNAYWNMRQTDLIKVTDSGSSSVIAPGVNLFDLTSTGSTYYVVAADGIKGGLDAAAPAVLYTGTYNSSAQIEFLKGRLVFAQDNKVYQLVTTASSSALPATPTYTHQDTRWKWKSFTDGPTAIYGAGDSGTTSEIHKFSPTIDSSGVPVLTWIGVTATMPTGEYIRDIYQYVGSFVGIATNKGFRVGDIDSNGDISYGPLLFEPAGGCQGIVGSDRFMWVGTTTAHNGGTGLYRVDLGSSIQEQTTRAVRYAYARDVYSPLLVGTVASVTMFGTSDRKVYSIPGYGTLKEYQSQLLENGYLETGRVRFNTEEPKLYKFFSVRTPTPLKGNVAVSVLTEGGGDITHFTFGPTNAAGVKDVAIKNPTQPQNWIKLRFTFFRGTDTAYGGVLNGWQLKTLPGSIRQRVITQVFQLFDEETDRTGQRIGYDGYARARFEDFKALARAGDVYPYQELQEDMVTQVVIDDWEFRQTAPPGPNRGALGGYLTVVMRTVAEST